MKPAALTALLAPVLLLAGCMAVQPVAAPPARPGPMMPHSPVPVGLRFWVEPRVAAPGATVTLVLHTPQPEGLRFTVEPGIAAPGATVTLVLHNGTAQEIGYNLCDSPLEQLRSGAWRTPAPSGVPGSGELTVPCPALLMGLAPGREARYPRQVPATLAAGTYRFGTRVGIPPFDRGLAGFILVHSEPVTVR